MKPVDDNDPRPAYRQVADDLRESITKGKLGLRPGDKLKSIRDLAGEYGVAPQTMQNALRELRNANLVVSQQGRGLFVRDPSRPVSKASKAGSEQLAAVESELSELQQRVAAIEADNDALHSLIMDLYGRTGQPYPQTTPKGVIRREQSG